MLRRLNHTPSVMPRDTNFMTPNMLSYWSFQYDGKTLYAELSEGEGIRHEPIFGVTIRPDEHKLSRMFYDQAEAMRYLAALAGKDATDD